MIEKLKAYWERFWVLILAAVITLAYTIGHSKGTENEKNKSRKKLLQNLSQARKAVDSLRNPDVVKRLHNKYKR